MNRAIIINILIAFPFSLFGQIDLAELTQQQLEDRFLLDERIECRVNYRNDSLLMVAVNQDVEENLRQVYRKFYRIGNAAGIAIPQAQNIAFRKHNLILEYTYCVYCPYQKEFDKLFSKYYKEQTGKDLKVLITEIEIEAQKQREKLK